VFDILGQMIPRSEPMPYWLRISDFGERADALAIARSGSDPATRVEPAHIHPPGTIPTTCHSHRLYDCWMCHPRIAIEAASDEDMRRARMIPKGTYYTEDHQ